MSDRKYSWLISFDLQAKTAAAHNVHTGQTTTHGIPSDVVERRAFIAEITGDIESKLSSSGNIRAVVVGDYVGRDDEAILAEMLCPKYELARHGVLDCEYQLPGKDDPMRREACKAEARRCWLNADVEKSAMCLLGLHLARRYRLDLDCCHIPRDSWRPARWRPGDTNITLASSFSNT